MKRNGAGHWICTIWHCIFIKSNQSIPCQRCKTSQAVLLFPIWHTFKRGFCLAPKKSANICRVTIPLGVGNHALSHMSFKIMLLGWIREPYWYLTYSLVNVFLFLVKHVYVLSKRLEVYDRTLSYLNSCRLVRVALSFQKRTCRLGGGNEQTCCL